MTLADDPRYRKLGCNIDITDKCVLACPKCMRQHWPGLHKRGSDLLPEDTRENAKNSTESKNSSSSLTPSNTTKNSTAQNSSSSQESAVPVV